MQSPVCLAGNNLFSAPESESSSTHHNLFGLAVIGPPGKEQQQSAAESSRLSQQDEMTQHDGVMSQHGGQTGAVRVGGVDESAAASLLQVCTFKPH